MNEKLQRIRLRIKVNCFLKPKQVFLLGSVINLFTNNLMAETKSTTS